MNNKKTTEQMFTLSEWQIISVDPYNELQRLYCIWYLVFTIGFRSGTSIQLIDVSDKLSRNNEFYSNCPQLSLIILLTILTAYYDSFILEDFK